MLIWALNACTDLKTMHERLKNRYYHHRRLFEADMLRIFTNCRAYNAADTEYCKCANSLEKFYKQKMRDAKLIDWVESSADSLWKTAMLSSAVWVFIFLRKNIDRLFQSYYFILFVIIAVECLCV